MKTLKFISMLFIASALCFGFACCSGDDDNEPQNPTEETDKTDYSKLIPGHWRSSASNDDVEETISFNHKGTGTMIYLYDDAITDWGILAEGNYTLSSNKITANFTEVIVFNYSDSSKKSYNGFTNGQSKTAVYTIQSCDGEKMVLKDESGKTLTYTKYADINK